MEFWSDCPATALAAAGIVGQWEIDATTQSSRLDRAGAKFRYDDENLAGVPVPLAEAFAVVHPDDRERVFAHCRQCIEQGGPSFLEHRIILPRLGVRHLQIRGFFGLSAQDQTIGRGVIIDVTPHVTAVVEAPRSIPVLPRMPYAPLFDPLAEAAAHGIEVREALGQSGHGALRLAADLLLFEINTALAERMTVSDKPVPGLPGKAR